MAQARDIAVLVGGLRKESWNRKAAEAVAKLAPQHLRFAFPDLVVSPYNALAAISMAALPLPAATT